MRRIAVEGEAAVRYARLKDAFAGNFDADVECPEVGAGLAVYEQGELVVDLWAGHKDTRRQAQWDGDTLVNVMSVSKGVVATCAHLLADRGLLDLDQTVAHYWPEFAQYGKERILVRHLLNHTAGLPYLHAPMPGRIYDWQAMTEALAASPGRWEPGTVRCYHPMTMGFLVGELVRRITGVSMGAFFRREIAVPFGIDFIIGLTESELPRVATFIEHPGHEVMCEIEVAPDSPLAKVFGELSPTEDFNSRAWRMSEIPAANGHASARGIARLYGALGNGGQLDGKTLLGQDALVRATREQWHGKDDFSGADFRMSLGFLLSNPPAVPFGPCRDSFGHPGMGGSVGFADPKRRLGVGYVMNDAVPGMNVVRFARLAEALYG